MLRIRMWQDGDFTYDEEEHVPFCQICKKPMEEADLDPYISLWECSNALSNYLFKLASNQDCM